MYFDCAAGHAWHDCAELAHSVDLPDRKVVRETRLECRPGSPAWSPQSGLHRAGQGTADARSASGRARTRDAAMCAPALSRAAPSADHYQRPQESGDNPGEEHPISSTTLADQAVTRLRTRLYCRLSSA